VVGNEYSAAHLLLYDVKDPAAPGQVQVMDIPVGKIWRVAILFSGSNVILANGEGGVEVLSGGS